MDLSDGVMLLISTHTHTSYILLVIYSSLIYPYLILDYKNNLPEIEINLTKTSNTIVIFSECFYLSRNLYHGGHSV